jgi:molecular chaperone DnaK (HSP70)
VPYVLGIDLGASTTKAAICRRTGGPDGSGIGWAPPQPASLGIRTRIVASALVLTPTGTVIAAEPGHDPGDAVSGYLRLVGDDIPMLFGTDYFPAHGMVAAMARWVVDRVWQQLDEPPERVALAYPTGWGPGRLELVHAALAEAELAGTVLVTRARAVVESFQAAGRAPSAGGMLLVYRLGASTVEVSVVVPHGPGRLELLGSAELDEVSGFELDDRTPEDARAVLQPTVDLAAHVVRGCGGDPADLSAVLIGGGSGNVHPVVSDLLSAAFPVPVLRDHDPQMTVAVGAALAGRPQAPAVPPTGAAPAPRPTTEVVRAAAPEAWPEIDRGGRATPDRPPRPPVQVTTLKASRR